MLRLLFPPVMASQLLLRLLNVLFFLVKVSQAFLPLLN